MRNCHKKMDAQSLFMCLFVLFVSTQLGEASQCKPDPSNLCAARCNGTSYDLSKAFNFPLNITEPTSRGYNDLTYWYMWDPCHNVQCPGFPDRKDCAVCQKADQFYSCGTTDEPIWLQEDWPRTKVEDWPNWQIQYTDGTTWRITVFNFIVDHKVEEPTVTFISEDPYLQYNFEVRGKCIGQEFYECHYSN